MYILGIHDGHNCGASLILNGKVLFSICEERLSRNKNEVGYPTESINRILFLSDNLLYDQYDIIFDLSIYY